jgi:hypothetical protein
VVILAPSGAAGVSEARSEMADVFADRKKSAFLHPRSEIAGIHKEQYE